MDSGPIYRMQQFFAALFQRLNNKDQQFISNYLNIAEASLFNQLPAYEKKHAVNVARKMLALMGDASDSQKRVAVKIGLLHDIGKSQVKISLVNKSLMVMLRFFLPTFYKMMSQKGEAHQTNSYCRKVYIYDQHAKLGAQMLSRAGEDQVIVDVVSSHTAKLTPSDKGFLRWLKKADTAY